MKVSKKLSALLAFGMAISFSATSSIALAQGVNVNVNVNTTNSIVGSGGDVDWMDTHMITAVGIGVPPQGMTAGATALARRAALVDAQRALAETMYGVQIDSETTVEMLAVQSDIVRSRISAVVKGFRVISEGSNPDGSYYIQIGVPLFGNASLASVVIPELKSQSAPEPLPVVDINRTVITSVEVTSIKNSKYTGLVINAGGLDLAPTFSPVIYNMKGEAIYGIKNVNSDYAIIHGMVSYSSDPEAAQVDPRVGSHPLIVNAEKVAGGLNSVNPVNVIVSDDDAERILLANQGNGFLENCAVVFVR